MQKTPNDITRQSISIRFIYCVLFGSLERSEAAKKKQTKLIE